METRFIYEHILRMGNNTIEIRNNLYTMMKKEKFGIEDLDMLNLMSKTLIDYQRFIRQIPDDVEADLAAHCRWESLKHHLTTMIEQKLRDMGFYKKTITRHMDDEKKRIEYKEQREKIRQIRIKREVENAYRDKEGSN